jgi:hypothetical protein
MEVFNLIISVKRTYCGNLSEMKRVGNNTVKLPDGVIWDDIPIKVPASMTISDKVEDKIIVYTASLSFSTCISSFDRKKYVYLVKASDGVLYLLGSYERPFSVMTMLKNFPDDPKSNQLNSVTVLYKTGCPIPFVIK